MAKKILVLNSGSSSLKYQLFEVEDGSFNVLAKGGAERIGLDGSFVKHQVNDGDAEVHYADLPNHSRTIDEVFKLLCDETQGVIKEVKEIDGVGHRVVHGGEDFASSVLVTKEVKEAIHCNAVLAPLHNPPNLLGIQAVEKILPEMPQVAVFDTAVHQTMPKKAFMYGLPESQYSEHKIRRYGFHGTSHGYVCRLAAKKLGKPVGETKIITCHIGNGGSIAAFDGGKSVDTSMGLTPLQGILMGTRCGDLDPAIVLHIMETQGLNAKQMSAMMNKEGGLLGLCGHSDMRDVTAEAEKGNEHAIVARQMYAYSIRKYIGAYMAVLGGCDAIVFTAGVGENTPWLRTMVLENMEFAGIKIDAQANEVRGAEAEVSAADSKVKVYVIPTDEEKVIAEDTYNLLK